MTVAALNYLHAGSRRVPLSVMRRPPNKHQAKALDYIGRLIKTCAGCSSISVPESSRRARQLLARLGEVSDNLTALGFSSDKYGPSFPHLNLDGPAAFDALHPYRSLDPGRLKLSGTANWDPSEYLDDLFYLPFREPDLLLLWPCPSPGPSEVPDLSKESAVKVYDLARRWDNFGLLRLACSGPSPWFQGVRVFNALKTAKVDRQIGDKRGRNLCEGTLAGPSSALPCGPQLTSMYIDPARQEFSISVTDRSDFYHQLAVPPRRALRNVLVPPVEAARVADLRAFQSQPLLDDVPSGLRRGGPCKKLFACFSAVLQGDALGVEVATSSHSRLLSSEGLLGPGSRLCGGQTYPHGAPEGLVQGLIIDDFFAISCPEVGAKGPSHASRALAQARLVYAREGLLGSVEKDIDGSCCATVGGAELDSSASTRSLGIATVGPPRAKRLGLAAISLESCRLRKTSDVLHLCLVGGWVSGFCYRKALMACFDKVFSFVDATKVDSGCPRVVSLPRSVADELVLAAALSHVLVSDVAAPWAEELFATDSSESRGAIVRSPISKDVTSLLWCSTSKAAGPARLLSREEAALRRIDPDYEPRLPPPSEGTSPKRPPACRFHFLQLWGASKGIGHYLEALGWTSGPCIDPRSSVEYDPSSVRVFEWAAYLVEAGRLDSLCICLPLATFSTHGPSGRSHAAPGGLRPSTREARANRYTAHSFALLHVCLRHGVPAALLHSRDSFVPKLKGWQGLCKKREVQVTQLPFGSDGGGTLFLSVGFPPLDFLTRSWRRDLLVQPPAPSPGEAAWLEAAAAFDVSLDLRSRALAECRLDTEGLETPLVNDLALSLGWSTLRAWSWPSPVHINILECSCIYRLMCSLARRSGPLRFVSLCDSAVTCHALRKGRSPSRGLRRVLRRISAVSLAFGLYPSAPYCPTRLMPADHPSRDAEIPDPLPSRLGHLVGYDALLPLTRIVPARRWASNWLRLFFGLTGYRPLGANEPYRFQGHSVRTFVPCPLDFCSSASGCVPFGPTFVRPPRPSSPPVLDFDSSLGFPGEGPPAPGGVCRRPLGPPVLDFGSSLGFPGEGPLAFCGVPQPAFRPPVLDFDPSLGFPGEGPLACRASTPRPSRPPVVDFDSSLGFPGEGPFLQSKCAFSLGFLAFWCFQGVQGQVPVAASHGSLLPRSARDRLRQERRGTGDLPAGRPVEPVTQKNREALWASFCDWLATAGIERGLFESTEGQQDVDGINAILGRYGRELYRAGRPYAHYSETLNAFSSRVPKLRRLLQPAWDVAFAWRREEPSLHHAAMPWQVLISLVTTSLLWGWVKVAGALALAWGGLLRIGEVLGALRSDLLLPSDVQGTSDYALLSIRNPKTRFSAARHQAVRVDQPNLLAILELVYQKVPAGCKLWPLSGQTLRSRFQQLCSALQLPVGRAPGRNGLELSSLRAGGATWLMNTVEDSEFVRRRGRWLSHRIMEIYIQEVTSLQFLPTLPAPAREKVFLALETFPVIFDRVVYFASVGILPTVWYKLLAEDSFTMTGGANMGGRLRKAVAAQDGRHVDLTFARQKGKKVRQHESLKQ